MTPRLKVLFLCTGNSCRSQMAEGWMRHLHAEEFEAYSAGTLPGRLDPRAVQVMREAGVDISGQPAKHLDAVADVGFDYVVSVCDQASESCPVFPGRVRRRHRAFDDPPRLAQGAPSRDEALVPYRRVRDEIRAWVEELPRWLAEESSAEGGR